MHIKYNGQRLLLKYIDRNYVDYLSESLSIANEI